MSETTIRGAVIGYGGAFNMGKGHLDWMQAAGILPAAACDIDPARMASAETDFPGIRTYTRIEDLLADQGVDLVTVITPHNSHAKIAMEAAKAGKSVVVEKPMSITTEEATLMIEAANASGVTLSVFHNRRYDGDFLAIKSVIDEGLIGEVFQIQAGSGGYGDPGSWWRSSKEISGGILYDWGAHFVDWILNLFPGQKVTQVTGFLQKKIWTERTNEDHGQVVMRFDSGAVAELTQSSMMLVPMPRWRILGTKGGILDDGSVKDGFKLFTQAGPYRSIAEVKNKPTEWNLYYKHLAAHLRGDGPSPVTPESARRMIAIFEAAETSSRLGTSVSVAYE